MADQKKRNLGLGSKYLTRNTLRNRMNRVEIEEALDKLQDFISKRSTGYNNRNAIPTPKELESGAVQAFEDASSGRLGPVERQVGSKIGPPRKSGLNELFETEEIAGSTQELKKRLLSRWDQDGKLSRRDHFKLTALLLDDPDLSPQAKEALKAEFEELKRTRTKTNRTKQDNSYAGYSGKEVASHSHRSHSRVDVLKTRQLDVSKAGTVDIVHGGTKFTLEPLRGQEGYRIRLHQKMQGIWQVTKPNARTMGLLAAALGVSKPRLEKMTHYIKGGKSVPVPANRAWKKLDDIVLGPLSTDTVAGRGPTPTTSALIISPKAKDAFKATPKTIQGRIDKLTEEVKRKGKIFNREPSIIGPPQKLNRKPTSSRVARREIRDLNKEPQVIDVETGRKIRPGKATKMRTAARQLPGVTQDLNEELARDKALTAEKRSRAFGGSPDPIRDKQRARHMLQNLGPEDLKDPKFRALLMKMAKRGGPLALIALALLAGAGVMSSGASQNGTA